MEKCKDFLYLRKPWCLFGRGTNKEDMIIYLLLEVRSLAYIKNNQQ